MFSLESPHRGDSNEYTQYTIFSIKKKITLNYLKSAAMGFFCKGTQKRVRNSRVNESSVFEPLKFYCIPFSYSGHGFERASAKKSDLATTRMQERGSPTSTSTLISASGTCIIYSQF